MIAVAIMTQKGLTFTEYKDGDFVRYLEKEAVLDHVQCVGNIQACFKTPMFYGS